MRNWQEYRFTVLKLFDLDLPVLNIFFIDNGYADLNVILMVNCGEFSINKLGMVDVRGLMVLIWLGLNFGCLIAHRLIILT